MSAERDLVRTRFARGCRCYAVKFDGAVGGYGWLSTGPEWIGEIQLEIKPREKDGYIWNCVTVPERRRQGVFRSLVAGISLAARRSGVRRLWIGSVAIPAEKALEPLGFRPALSFDMASLAGLHLMRVSQSSNAGLAADASSALGVRPGLVIRRSHPRRH
jgi:GNAT superfamily N-acetyltransferase